MIIIGVLLILGSLAAVLASAIAFVFRRTYFRQVSIAVKNGQSPYQAAIDGAEAMANYFMTVTVIYAAFVIVLSVLLIGLSFLRPEASRE